MDHQRDIKASCVLLGKAAHALSIALHEPEIIQVLLDEAIAAYHARAAMVRLLSANGDELILAGSRGLSETYLQKGPVKISESKADQRVMAGEIVTMPDLAREAGFRFPTEAAQEGLRGEVAVPLSVRGRVNGVFRIYVDEVESLSSEDLALLRIVADLGALTLEKVRLHQCLYRIAEALNSSLELQPMLQRVLEATVEKMHLKAASIRLWSSKDRILHLAASFGLSAAYLEKGTVHVDFSPIDRQVLNGETVLLYDVEMEPGFQYPEEARREGIRSVLVVPLQLKQRTVGVMRVYSAQPRHYGPVDISFLTSIADLVALAVENAELYGALRARYENLKTDLADWYQFLALG